MLKKDFYIKAKLLNEDKEVILLEDQTVKTELGLAMHITKMWQKWRTEKTCYKLDLKWNETKEIDIQDFGLQLFFKCYKNKNKATRV